MMKRLIEMEQTIDNGLDVLQKCKEEGINLEEDMLNEMITTSQNLRKKITEKIELAEKKF